MTQTSQEFIQTEVVGRVALLTMNRPSVNAISKALAEQLGERFAELSCRPDVHAFVLTGGERRFSAGMDIKELLTENLEDPDRAVPTAQRFHAIFSSIAALKQPVIAAINGYALGGAFMLSLYCDIRVAAEDATFALPEIKLGSVPSFGLPRVARLAGPGFAKRMALGAELISAREAYDVRLVDAVAPPGGAIVRALDMATRIAAMPVLAAQGCKEALSVGAELPLERAQARDWQIADRVAHTADRNECLRAFVEKREPHLTGR